MCFHAKQLTKLNVLLNKCTHRILSISSYRLNTTTIFNKLNWLSYHQIIMHESVKLMYRISHESQPPALSQLLYHSLVRSDINRQVRKPSVKYKSLSAKHQTISCTGQFMYTIPCLTLLGYYQKTHFQRNLKRTLRHILALNSYLK